MKIAIACGGTGGHIFPGLATAHILRDRGHDVTLWMAGKDVEADALKSWPGRVEKVRSRGFEQISLRAFGTAWGLAGAVRKCRAIMRDDPPDVLLAMGSYASVGPLGAALTLRIPFVLHEANVVPGRAVALFARRAAAVAGCFEETRYYMRHCDLALTGMPLRRELIEASALPPPARTSAKFSVLVMGGSRGAHALNTVVSRAICRAHAAGTAIRVVHLTGPADEAAIREQYTRAGVDHDVRAFTHDMAALYRGTDLAVCRSGAATCAELSSFGVPSLLVPYPYAARDHQMANARAMERARAADVVPESDLSAAWLAGYLAHHVRERDRLRRMAEAARARAEGSGADRLASLVESVIRSIDAAKAQISAA